MTIGRCSTFIAITTLAFACASPRETRRSPAPMPVARAAEVIEPYDLKFIDSMTHHHQQGVAMAQIAWRKASHEELRTFAKELVSKQRDEIEKLNEWREAWFEGEASARDTELDGIGMNVLSKLEQTSDEDFDFYFVQAMIEHHEHGMAMANDALENATHDELKEFAERMISDQTEERRQMNAWARFWM